MHSTVKKTRMVMADVNHVGMYRESTFCVEAKPLDSIFTGNMVSRLIVCMKVKQI